MQIEPEVPARWLYGRLFWLGVVALAFINTVAFTTPIAYLVGHTVGVYLVARL